MVEILSMSIYNLLHVFYELLERVWLARRQTAILCSPACDSLGQIKLSLRGEGRLFFPGSNELVQVEKASGVQGGSRETGGGVGIGDADSRKANQEKLC